MTGNATRDDAPSHIRIQQRVPRELAEAWQWMCPAGVYEMPEDAPRGGLRRPRRQPVQLRPVRGDHRQGRPPDPARGRRRPAVPRHLTRAPGSPAAGAGSSAGASWRGKRTLKRAPPRAEDADRRPRAPWWRACWPTSARPSPEPAPVVPSSRAKGSKIAHALGVGMPGPSSSTSSRARGRRPGAVERDADLAAGAAVDAPRSRPGCRPAAAAPAPSPRPRPGRPAAQRS